MQALIFIIVIVTASGIVFQCVSNRRERHVQFLSFPIAALIQLPYPMWATFSWLTDNTELLLISFVMGLPSAWLSAQYFYFHGLPLRGRWKVEELVTLVFLVFGLVWLVIRSGTTGLVQSLAETAAYFTCVIAVFSYLVKIARVARGSEDLEGLRWPTLVMLLVFYCAMLGVGERTNVAMLHLAYLFSVFACTLAVFYKAWGDIQSKKKVTE